MTDLSVFNGFGVGRIDCRKLVQLASQRLPVTAGDAFHWADGLATRHAIGTIEVLTLLAGGHTSWEIVLIANACDMGVPVPPPKEPVDWNAEDHRIYPEEGTS